MKRGVVSIFTQSATTHRPRSHNNILKQNHKPCWCAAEASLHNDGFQSDFRKRCNSVGTETGENATFPATTVRNILIFPKKNNQQHQHVSRPSDHTAFSAFSHFHVKARRVHEKLSWNEKTTHFHLKGHVNRDFNHLHITLYRRRQNAAHQKSTSLQWRSSFEETEGLFRQCLPLLDWLNGLKLNI